MSPSIDDQLRSLLDVAAPDDTHVEERWAELAERLADDGTAPAPLPERRPRRWLAIAAAVVVVAAVAAGVAWERSGGGEPEPLDPSSDQPTGWYVPEGLEGWTLESVTGDLQAIERRATCPCSVTSLIADDGASALVVADSVAPPSSDIDEAFGGGEPVDIGGRDGRRSVEGIATWAWIDGDRYRSAMMLEVPDAEQAALAAAIADGADVGRAAEAPGYEVVAFGEAEADERAIREVTVTMREDATGDRVAYVLTPSGIGSVPALFLGVVPEAVELPGQPLPLVHVDPPPGSVFVQPSYAGAWPGADIAADVQEPAPEDALPDGTIEAVLGSLRPATGDEWRAFLATAEQPVDADPDLGVDRIDDLVVRD